MQLYAWQPGPENHWDRSIFIVAEDEITAKARADAFVAEAIKGNENGFNDYMRWNQEDVGEAAYKLTVAEVGEIITNRNE